METTAVVEDCEFNKVFLLFYPQSEKQESTSCYITCIVCPLCEHYGQNWSHIVLKGGDLGCSWSCIIMFYKLAPFKNHSAVPPLADVDTTLIHLLALKCIYCRDRLIGFFKAKTDTDY